MTEKCGLYQAGLYTVPPGTSFVDALANGLLEKTDGAPEKLAEMHLLLPTRRACRSLREAFLRRSNGKPLLLPRMSPLGDMDEDELALMPADARDALDLPPAIAPMRRLFLLTRLIQAQGRGSGIEQDMALAQALARLMDEVHTENLHLSALPSLVDRAEFSAHWQVSLDFLSILSDHWPAILKEEGVIEAADRRGRLLQKRAAHWEAHPPAYPVIAAGTTGSIPATARLLKVIAGLPQGFIVLPGLDQVMDDESWDALDDTHPQATLKNLLGALEAERGAVRLWPACAQGGEGQQRLQRFASEIMRPAATTRHWQQSAKALGLRREDLNIERYDCDGPQEEALVIALALRRALEEAGRTAALVTPDRRLARRVAMICRRWDIAIDDSGGTPLPQTRAGTFLLLLADMAAKNFKPVSLLDFCKHALCLPHDRPHWRRDVRAMDKYLLRGPAFEGGFGAYRKKITAREAERKDNPALKDLSEFSGMMDFLERQCAELIALQDNGGQHGMEEWCAAHLAAAERFCGPAILWAGQDGEAAAEFFAALLQDCALLPPVTLREYQAILEAAMKPVTVRPAYGLHPRLMILGQLEARLVEADTMILAGLNEGTWPPAPPADPWMSRPMRKRFGLPPAERGTGLSAHDFAQNICAGHLVLTRSRRVDGTPTVPARWLQRMDTVLHAAGFSQNPLMCGDLLSIARAMDAPQTGIIIERPRPAPPLNVRPRRLSVTKIDTWMKDPYSIYAQYILKLRALDPLEKDLDAAMKGTILHNALHHFVTAYPDHIPPSAQDEFLAITRAELDAAGVDDSMRAFWEPRLEKIARWFCITEKNWRAAWVPRAQEIDGAMVVPASGGDFTLTVRADRIDLSRDGTRAAILDYKSGGQFSQSGMESGKYPQLPLEAIILESGGFQGMKNYETSALAYWVLNGGGEGGKTTCLEADQKISQAKENAREGLAALIDRFDDPAMPYYSLPRPEFAPPYNDYEYLARVREWTALDEQEDAA
ncbi:MAG: double-strand break repair protein AddB [Micavibrio sp.]